MFLVDGVGLMDFWRITVLRHACFPFRFCQVDEP